MPNAVTSNEAPNQAMSCNYPVLPPTVESRASSKVLYGAGTLHRQVRTGVLELSTSSLDVNDQDQEGV